jgi:hypothetical protein
MIKAFLTKGILPIIPQLFKDHKGKWSSRRTVSGVLAMACVIDMEVNGITTNSLILAFIAVLPLCFSVFEKK